MTSDGELLRRYTEAHSEDAFAELVRRHLALVYSAALRQANGDNQLAQEVTQSVFADLAQKAASLVDRQALAGWLYTGAHYAAAKVVRSEQRRHIHEQEAHAMQQLLQDPGSNADWETLRPVLDKAMHELSEPEREVILLRYFENRPHAEIGEQLGLTENAARMRVERAVEKLRTVLSSRGVTISTVGLAAAVSANAVSAVPAGLASTLSTAALTGTTLATTATATATKTIVMTTLQKAVVTVALTATVGVGIYEARQASALRRHVQTLQQEQVENTQQLQRERDEAMAKQAQLQDENARLNRNSSELLRLRGEVTLLRRQMAEGSDLSKDPKRTEALQAALAKLRASTSMGNALMAITLFQPWWPVPELLSELAQIMKVNQFAASALSMGDAIVGIAGGESSKMDAAFRPLLQDSNPKVRREAANVLAQVLRSASGPDVIRVAIEALKSTDDNVRVVGFSALANAAGNPNVWQSRVTPASLGPAAADATAALLDIAKNSQRTDVRDTALKMLETLNPDLTQLDPSLQASIRQSQQMTAFLDKAGTGKASLPEIIEGLHQFPKAAPMIAHLLEGRGAEAQSVLPALQDALAALAPQPDATGPDRGRAFTGREQIADAMQRISPDQPKALFTQTDMRSVMEIIRDPEVRSDPDRRQKLSTAFRSVLPDERSSAFEMTPEQMHRLLEALKGADQPTYEAVTQRVKKIDPHFFPESAR